MRRILLYLVVHILSLSTVGAQQFTDTTVIYYRYGHAGIDPSYKANKAAMQAFRTHFAGLMGDSSLRSVSLHIDSYCSPEGSPAANERLSAKRADIASVYLKSVTSGVRITAESHGIDWGDVSASVNTSPERIYPLLRRSVITLAYTIRPFDLPVVPNPLPVPGISAGRLVLQGHASPDAKPHPSACHTQTLVKDGKASCSGLPFLSVKTNLLLWAAVMPDFHTYTPVPNLELEWFFKKRWSLAGTGSFAQWAYGRDNYFGISSWSLEPRWWLWGDGSYGWLYLGMYTQTGDYDVQHSRLSLDGATGKFYGGGLSLGAVLPFTERWGIEIGLRGGYRHSNVSEYLHEAPHYYLENAYTDRHWGLTGLKASLYYRFGRSNKNHSIR